MMVKLKVFAFPILFTCRRETTLLRFWVLSSYNRRAKTIKHKSAFQQLGPKRAITLGKILFKQFLISPLLYSSRARTIVMMLTE